MPRAIGYRRNACTLIIRGRERGPEPVAFSAPTQRHAPIEASGLSGSLVLVMSGFLVAETLESSDAEIIARPVLEHACNDRMDRRHDQVSGSLMPLYK